MMMACRAAVLSVWASLSNDVIWLAASNVKRVASLSNDVIWLAGQQY